MISSELTEEYTLAEFLQPRHKDIPKAIGEGAYVITEDGAVPIETLVGKVSYLHTGKRFVRVEVKAVEINNYYVLTRHDHVYLEMSSTTKLLTPKGTYTQSGVAKYIEPYFCTTTNIEVESKQVISAAMVTMYQVIGLDEDNTTIIANGLFVKLFKKEK
jgi:hypothetical protein